MGREMACRFRACEEVGRTGLSCKSMRKHPIDLVVVYPEY